MIGYVLRRLANYIVLLFVAVSLTYVLAATQLNPRSLFLMRNPPLDPRSIESMLLSRNLSENVPLWERYWTWLTNVLTKWDWGQSPMGAVVNDEIGARIWVSLRLLLIGTMLGLVLGVAIGAWAATRQYKISDRVITVLTLLVVSTPAFVIGHVAQILATEANRQLGYQFFEFIGETGQVHGEGWWPVLADRLQHLLLPTVVLMLLGLASMSRIQRNLMLDALGSDFVRTARAKGLRENKAVMKHALRTALIPTATYVAFTVATMFVGATYTEKIFGFRGMGAYGIDTIQGQDINGVVAVTAFAGVCVLVGAVLSDIFVAILDPRVRLS